MTAGRYYPGITLFKVCGAILVVLAHIAPFWEHGLISGAHFYTYAAPLSVIVPCFYVVSGFLVTIGLMRSADRGHYVRLYLLRIGIIYAALVVVYVASWLATEIIDKGMSWALLYQLVKRTAVAAVFGPEAFLWFVPPLLAGLLIVYWLSKRGLLLKALPVVGAGFLACVVLRGHSNVLLVKAFTNYWGYGLTFVALGSSIARHQEWFRGIKLRYLVAAGIVVTGAETAVLIRESLSLGTFPLCVCAVPNTLLLFRGMLAWSNSGKAQRHHFWNLFSGIMYFGHYPIYEVGRLAGIIPASNRFATQFTTFVSIVAICVICTFVVSYMLARRPVTGAARARRS